MRLQVELRAAGVCEYCRIAIEDTYFGGEIDHITSLKHRGLTEFENLALACQPCNRNKGSDLGSLSESSKILVRFFNPRTDEWCEHFRLNPNGEIEFLTEIGEVTAIILGFNNQERIAERKGLIEIGNYQI
ncbi:MAG: HNH endonuclease [Acidobacteria bacterium]|nr:HNH endonuclease [Acidobacteriota bacterium]